MIRTIVKIDEKLCNGCGACASACQEGAIAMIDGKARLIRDDYCDGLGNCLPACPTGAISFEEREALAYDHEAVTARMAALEKAAALKNSAAPKPTAGCPGSASRVISRPDAGQAQGGPAHAAGCPGSMSRVISRPDAGQAQGGPAHAAGCPGSMNRAISRPDAGQAQENAAWPPAIESRLSQWPVQIKLVPIRAPYFDGAKLLIAADCTAYAYGNFHRDFIAGHITLIGCPKLDDVDYAEKLTEIIRQNDIKSVTVVRMEVPCCGGIERAVRQALMDSGKFIPWQVYTIATDGRILD